MRNPLLARGAVAGVDDQRRALFGIATADVKTFSADPYDRTVACGPVLTRCANAGSINDRGPVSRCATLHIETEASDAGDLPASAEGPLLIPPRIAHLHDHSSPGLRRAVIDHVYAHVAITTRNLLGGRTTSCRNRQKRHQGEYAERLCHWKMSIHDGYSSLDYK